MKDVRFISSLVVFTLLVGNQLTRAADPNPDRPMISPTEALSRLKEGNGRFIAGNMQHPHDSTDERAYIAKNSYENPDAISLGMTSEQAAKRRAELTKSQHPFDHPELFRFACAARTRL